MEISEILWRQQKKKEEEFKKTYGVTADPATKEMLEYARTKKIPTVFDRVEKFEAVLPVIEAVRCPFGSLGVCCRNCANGPCRVLPEDPAFLPRLYRIRFNATEGICGADRDLMVARSLLRFIAGGTAAHVEHGVHVAETLMKTGKKEAPYEITDKEKLLQIAKKIGIETEGKEIEQIAVEVGLEAWKDFVGSLERDYMVFAESFTPKKRVEKLKELGVFPRSGYKEIAEAMHRTTQGVDADPVNIILHAVRCGLADFYSLLISTLLQDVLFGTPSIVETETNFGVLREENVNIIVHGHVPLLSEKVVEWSERLEEEARAIGAEGITVAGICCTGNEVLSRHGIPQIGNTLQQELAILSGVVDAFTVDVQCIMPSLANIASHYHTRLITTQNEAKMPQNENVIHIEFSEERADEVAEKIVKEAINNYKNRSNEVKLIDEKSKLIAGVSVEAILDLLNGDLAPLLDAIKEGKIKGAVGIVGCNNPKVTHDYNHVNLARELIKRDILVVTTGCSGHALAKAGLLLPEAREHAGEGLRAICGALGIPPVLHMGSCVDNSRIFILLGALADALDVDLSNLPVAASAPEWATEKAAAIGTGAVALGLLVHLGVVPPVAGSELVSKLLAVDAESLFGGKFAVEVDPREAANIIENHIEEKRKALGI
ncbi:MAG: anaerobic carbon-monoxide dehydrogenase catalytic subunit [Candidatus Hydrothermarchaeota archaeon]